MIYQRNKTKRSQPGINSLELNPRFKQIPLVVVWREWINILVRNGGVEDFYRLGYDAV
jgi:hypothetical protein